MARTPPPSDYKDAAYVLTQQGSFLHEYQQFSPMLLGVGKSIDLLRGNLGKLSQEVKTAEQIFSNAARRGDAMGLRALGEYTVAHKTLSEVFKKSASAWSAGFQAVSHHAEGAHTQVSGLIQSFHLFQSHRIQQEADLQKGLQRRIALEKDLESAHQAGDQWAIGYLQQQKAMVEKQIVLANWSKKWSDTFHGVTLTFELLAITMGKAVLSAWNLQQASKDIAMNFSQSLGYTQTLLNAVAGSKGLVTLKEATAAFVALRGNLLSLIKGTEGEAIIRTVSRIGAATGISVDSIASLTKNLTIMVGPMNQDRLNNMGDTMAYFARQTDLGTAGVTEMIGKMEPLMTSYPAALRDKLVPQILALGAAFKSVGVSVDSTLQTIEQMRDITSMEGRRSLSFVAGVTGLNPMQMAMGNMDPARIGVAILQTRRTMMSRMMAGGMNANTAASILSRMTGLGSPEEFRKAAAISARQWTQMRDDMERNEAAANRVRELQKAMDDLTQGPMARLREFMVDINKILIGAGTKLFQDLKRDITWFNAQFPWIAESFKAVMKWIGGGREGGITWAINQLTRGIKILVPVVALMVIKHLPGLIMAGRQVISVFGMLSKTMLAAATSTAAYQAALAKTNAQQTQFAFMGGGATAARGMSAAQTQAMATVAGTRGGGIMAMLGLSSMAGWFSKMGGGIGGFLGKAGAGLGSTAGKLIPFIGVLVSLAFSLKEIWDILSDEKNRQNPLAWLKAVLKLVVGAVSGLSPLGFAAGLGINALADMIQTNTEATEENTDELEKKRKAEEGIASKEAWEKAIAGGHFAQALGGPATPLTSMYGEPLAGIPARGTAGNVVASAATPSWLTPGGGPGAGGIAQGTTGAGVSLVGQNVGGAKITHYGYPGDRYWDSNSGRGIGDRSNNLQAGVSVALTRSMRQQLFGTSGKSTGKTFTWGGQTYRDDDTAPQGDMRIDVYNPMHQGIDRGVSPQQVAARKKVMPTAYQESYGATSGLAQALGTTIATEIAAGTGIGAEVKGERRRPSPLRPGSTWDMGGEVPGPTIPRSGLAGAVGIAQGARTPRAVGNAAPGGRSSIGGVDPALVQVVADAEAGLPPGYKVEFFSGKRAAGYGYHPKGQAVDVQIRDPSGKIIPSQGADTTGLYSQLAVSAYQLAEQRGIQGFNWGGAFATRLGGNVPDLMHFDTGGERGRITQYRKGSLMSNAALVAQVQQNLAQQQQLQKQVAETGAAQPLWEPQLTQAPQVARLGAGAARDFTGAMPETAYGTGWNQRPGEMIPTAEGLTPSAFNIAPIVPTATDRNTGQMLDLQKDSNRLAHQSYNEARHDKFMSPTLMSSPIQETMAYN